MFRHGTLRILAWSSHEMNIHPTQWCFGVSTRGLFLRSTSLSSCWRRATPSTGTVRRRVSPSCTSWTSTSNVFICVIANRCTSSLQRKGWHNVKPRPALCSCGEAVCAGCVDGSVIVWIDDTDRFSFLSVIRCHVWKGRLTVRSALLLLSEVVGLNPGPQVC